jgi:FkbM family methyltransferase
VFQGRQYEIPTGPVADRVEHRYRQIISNGQTPVIVDAGANIGAASLWFANKFPEAHIVAVEPEPGNAAILSKNANKRMTVITAAIGATPGYVSIPENATGWGARTERSNRGIEIVTMSEAFGSVPDGCPFIAKIDIEGFESDLFSSNTEWLDHVHMVYIEPHDWLMPGKRTSGNFQRAMAQREFEIFISDENLIYVR